MVGTICSVATSICRVRCYNRPRISTLIDSILLTVSATCNSV